MMMRVMMRFLFMMQKIKLNSEVAR
jgi:hypothetical protein